MNNNQQKQQLIDLLIQTKDRLDQVFNTLRIDNSTLQSMQNFNDHQYLARLADDQDDDDNQNQQGLNIFQKYKTVDIDTSIYARIENLKMNHYSPSRIFQLFKSNKISQYMSCPLYYKKFNINIREELQNTNQQVQYFNQQLKKSQVLKFKPEDLQRLQPNNDLNDTIIGFYLKFIKDFFLTKEQKKSVFIYSTYFIGMLLQQMTKQAFISGKDPQKLISLARKKVVQNYSKVNKWTKNQKILEKQVLVFPINFISHWNCIFVLNPNAIHNSQSSFKKCQIIYCDSLFQRQQFLVETIRKYLQLYYNSKYKNGIQISSNILPCYQLLLPRQINSHDCGLFMLAYIQQFLANPEQLHNLSNIQKRRKLSLFPRFHILVLRQIIIKVILFMIKNKGKPNSQYLKYYMEQKAKLQQFYGQKQYDTINQVAFNNYKKLTRFQSQDPQVCYLNEIKFHLDKDINYYQSKF